MVYEAAQDEFNERRNPYELEIICNSMLYPYIVGGDFNILRHRGEKNTHFTPRFTDLFNLLLHTMGLRKIFMQGGLYNWSNKHIFPTMEKFDRVLMSWIRILFPLVTVKKIVREISHNNPLILNTRKYHPIQNKSREFKFDISWIKHVDFLPRKINLGETYGLPGSY